MNDKVTIDGKEYVLEDLPENLRNMVILHGNWQAEMAKTRADLFKTDLALNALIKSIREELDMSNKVVQDAEIVTR